MGKSPPIQMAELCLEKHSILFAYPDERDPQKRAYFKQEPSAQTSGLAEMMPVITSLTDRWMNPKNPYVQK